MYHRLLPYFREGYTPREVQASILEQVGAKWDDNDVLLIRAAVGAGKSLTADCIARWAYEERGLNTSIITPTSILVGQYLRDCPDMTTMQNKHSYPSRAAYETAKGLFKGASVKLANYFTYLTHRAYAPVLISDEAHKLKDVFNPGIRLWKHIHNYPDNLRDSVQLLGWAAENKDSMKTEAQCRTVRSLYKILSEDPTRYTIEIGMQMYRRLKEPKEMECLTLKLLSPRDSMYVMWPRSVKKIVLMSATLSREELYDMGLDTRRIAVIEGPSPISAENRPILYTPVANMSYKNQRHNVFPLSGALQELLSRHPEKGMIHSTYSLAARLKPLLKDDSRIIWHTKDNKQMQLRKWLDSPPEEGKVFMGCGLSEGLDLKGDLGRWQAVCKIAYPNKGDVTVAAKLEQRPSWYNWQAVRELEQSVGRICRGEDDYGVTYILTSEFSHLFNRNIDMFSRSFKEALI